MRLGSHITIKGSQVSDCVGTTTNQTDQAVRKFADCVSLLIGELECTMRNVVISLRRLMFATLHPRQYASQLSSESTRRLLIVLRHANLATVYMPQTGNTLASFKKVVMPVTSMDSRGMHTRNPCQLIGTLLLQDVIGHPGNVNPDWFKKWTCEVMQYA